MPRMKPHPIAHNARYRNPDQSGPDPRSPSGEIQLEQAGDCQAKRVILRFGGVGNLVKYMLRAGVRRTSQSIYHWVREGGLIPPNGVRDVFLAEVQAGIRLTDADWSPYIRTEQADAAEETPEDEEAAEEAPSRPRRLVL